MWYSAMFVTLVWSNWLGLSLLFDFVVWTGAEKLIHLLKQTILISFWTICHELIKHETIDDNWFWQQ